jgi:hypothetical protein
MAASFAQQSLQLGWRRMSRLLSAQEEVSCRAVMCCACLAIDFSATEAVRKMP